MQSDNQDRNIWHGNSFIFFKNKTSGRKDKIKMRPILSVLQNSLVTLRVRAHAAEPRAVTSRCRAFEATPPRAACALTLRRQLLQEKLIKLPCTDDAKLNF